HDMHQQGGNGARIFVPPFTEPFDPNMHPLLRMGQSTVGQAMASALLAEGKAIGWQESHAHFPVPYSKNTWTLQQQVDYGVTVAIAGMSHVAKYGHEWLMNFYRVHRDWVNYNQGPFAFVVSADQRDPYGAYEMLSILQFGAVEIQRATAAF